MEEEGTGAANTSVSSNGSDHDYTLPHISRWRLNLTALSQIYNLYFVAYRNRIYVSRPRSCVTNALPPHPDLVLKPQPSDMSADVGGTIDREFPHQVNHLIVGDLGIKEILLLAFDDGDVIAYYTAQIEEALVQRETKEGRPSNPIEPFFHENVQRSAWGLAIHKQSRLIAVGTNNHNVAVFIFALTGMPYIHVPSTNPVEFFRNLIKNERGAIVDPHGSSWALLPEEERLQKLIAMESLMRQRDANWRVVLESKCYSDHVSPFILVCNQLLLQPHCLFFSFSFLSLFFFGRLLTPMSVAGPMGGNIPNVAFTNDSHGEAEKIAAVDINGNVWLMDIWNLIGRPHIKIERIHQIPPRRTQRFLDPHEEA